MDQNIDLTKISSIPHHEMLAITNQYMIGCVDHINKVSDYAEKQMIDIDALIDGLENQVFILEAKLGIEYQEQQHQEQQQQQQQQEGVVKQMGYVGNDDLLPPPPLLD